MAQRGDKLSIKEYSSIQIKISLEKKEELKRKLDKEHITVTQLISNYIDEIILKDGNINLNNRDINNVISDLIDENLKLKKEIEKAKQRARRGGRKKIIKDKEIIRKIKNDKRSYRKLSEIYGVSTGTITRIKNNKY